MPVSEKIKASFTSGSFYHIVCKSIDGILLFYNPKDYGVYLDRFKKFSGDFLDVWSYCLLNNHTHFIIKVKSVSEIELFINRLTPVNKTRAMNLWMDDKNNEQFLDGMIERQMNSFLVSYANYIKNKYNHEGGLFQKPFKRIQIMDDDHLQQAVIYCNANAQKHQLADNFKLYPYSSFNATINNDHYFVQSKELLEFFGGKEKFIQIHNEQVAYFYTKGWPTSKLE